MFLANRIKLVPQLDLISPKQSGFLKGRFMGENIRLILESLVIVTSSLFHVFSHFKTTKKP